MIASDLKGIKETWDRELTDLDEVYHLVFEPRGFTRSEALILLHLNRLIRILEDDDDE